MNMFHSKSTQRFLPSSWLFCILLCATTITTTQLRLTQAAGTSTGVGVGVQTGNRNSYGSLKRFLSSWTTRIPSSQSFSLTLKQHHQKQQQQQQQQQQQERDRQSMKNSSSRNHRSKNKSLILKKELEEKENGALVVQGTRDMSIPSIMVWGALLAMNSGYINGLCLSGILSKTKQAGSAVTGAWTNSALGFAKDDFELYTFHTKCILSYMFGSFVSGLLYPTTAVSTANIGTGTITQFKSNTHKKHHVANHYHYPSQDNRITISIPSVQSLFFITSVLMYFASQIAKTGLTSSDTCIFLSLICNGIQNSLTSTTTSNLIRSSHFSGITSDIGTFMGQYLRGNKTNVMKLKVFWILACSFWLGGVISVGILQSLEGKEWWSFLGSSGLYAWLGLLAGYKSIRGGNVDVTKDNK